MNATTRYLCPICQTGHDERYAAEHCCPHEVREVLRCGECGVWFDLFEGEKAEACCKKKYAHRMMVAAIEQANRFCLCGERVSDADARDSKLLGTLNRCRSCILAVAPELMTADAIVRQRAA